MHTVLDTIIRYQKIKINQDFYKNSGDQEILIPWRNESTNLNHVEGENPSNFTRQLVKRYLAENLNAVIEPQAVLKDGRQPMSPSKVQFLKGNVFVLCLYRLF